MNNNINISPEVINSLTRDMVSSLEIARRTALRVQENEALSVNGFSDMHTLISFTSSAIRTTIYLNDILTFQNAQNSLKMGYCNINHFFTSIKDTLNQLFAGGYNISFNYISKLDEKRTFYINSICMEKTIYALIYCLVKNLKESDKKEIKIYFEESGLKDKVYILTITAGGKTLPKRLTEILNTTGEYFTSILDSDIAGLYAASKNAEGLGGTIKYQSTKTLNKFIFSFPHINTFDTILREKEEFSPDTDLLKIFFSDFIPEKLPEDIKNED